MTSTASAFDAFSIFDTDGDGLVSAGDIARTVRAAGLSISDADAAAFVGAADTDNDALISEAEFDAVRARGVSVASTPVEETFRAFDRDGSGFVSRDEMRNLAIHFGYPADDAAELMAAADADGDGKLSPAEFAELMKALGR
ncbi:EF-hand domain-containing protein [Nocardia blacklockiae]|uniref:EF-hand domain-containing protein n=1 Tax=Nocardia blacklockiae TaxID=480036 RepID=UPI00189585DD|nr:EF-hand domain-containing protein [Nocardia blacklockiae]MBF6174418.1 EF-hand domain-containing protein [Nocardia blacklockiae]